MIIWRDGKETISLNRHGDTYSLESTLDKGEGELAAAFNGMESLILSLANAGVDLTGENSLDGHAASDLRDAVHGAIQTTIDAIINRYDE